MRLVICKKNVNFFSRILYFLRLINYSFHYLLIINFDVRGEVNVIQHFYIIGVRLSRKMRGYKMTMVFLRARNDPSFVLA